MTELEFGKTYYPPKQTIEVTENSVRGTGWQAERVDNNIIFEFLAARHGAGVDRYNITEAEFACLKSGTLSADDLIKRYDVN